MGDPFWAKILEKFKTPFSRKWVSKFLEACHFGVPPTSGPPILSFVEALGM